MHSELLANSSTIREKIEVPPFPLDAIRTGVNRGEPRSTGRGSFVVAILAGFSIVAIAAAAEVAHHTNINFNPSGGMVISSDKTSSRVIHTNEEVRQAAERLDFRAIPPAGLPAGATPIKLDMAGTSLLTITYNLPASHRLWIFLANPNTITRSPRTRPSVMRLHKGYRVQLWRVGEEEVIAVSDSLTNAQFVSIKRAMASRL